jgi:hypothetical protein
MDPTTVAIGHDPFDQCVAQPLMIPLLMIVVHEFRHGSSEVSLAKVGSVAR